MILKLQWAIRGTVRPHFVPRLFGWLALVSIGACSFTLTAHALDAKVRSPVGCVGGSPNCDSDITLADALRSAERATKSIKECLANQERLIREHEERKAQHQKQCEQ